MPERKVICPNHGIIQTIELGAMWIGGRGPPEPFQYCPQCGERTMVEEPKREPYAIWDSKTPSFEEQQKAKDAEIEFYRHKYWPNRK
jgi:hypothetical protein